MRLLERMAKLEKVLGTLDTFRVIYVADGADKTAARDRYREETGYRGIIVVMDEADRAL